MLLDELHGLAAVGGFQDGPQLLEDADYIAGLDLRPPGAPPRVCRPRAAWPG
jgi:hypothetical protein